MTEPLDPIPLSALQHWAYCPRQCMLIHAEQAFEENLHTLRGRAAHQRVDEPGVEARAGLHVARAELLWCDRLGLVGKADVIEFLADGTPYPVEYKHGRKARAGKSLHDDLQLAAQALCLEEMTGRAVPFGAIYHASSRRRREVAITPELRKAVETTLGKIRHALATGRSPPPLNDTRCKECSLIELCQPQAMAAKARQRELADSLFIPED